MYFPKFFVPCWIRNIYACQIPPFDNTTDETNVSKNKYHTLPPLDLHLLTQTLCRYRRMLLPYHCKTTTSRRCQEKKISSILQLSFKKAKCK